MGPDKLLLERSNTTRFCKFRIFGGMVPVNEYYAIHRPITDIRLSLPGGILPEIQLLEIDSLIRWDERLVMHLGIGACLQSCFWLLTKPVR